MTTTAIDKRNKLVASDSRWSTEVNGNLFFVDDTGFDKIADRASGSIVCCGDGRLIEGWRNWFYEPRLNLAAMPPTERIHNGEEHAVAISLIQKPDCRILFSSGWYLIHENEVFFSGSGAPHAMQCYIRTGCGRTSIQTAGQRDPMTGGQTRFVDITTGHNNLSAKRETLAEVDAQLASRGMVMNMGTKKIVSFKEFSADPKNSAKKMSAGELQLSAPTGTPARAWSDSERSALRDALQVLADSESASA